MHAPMIGAIAVALLVVFVLIGLTAWVASTKLKEKSRSEAFADLASDLGLAYEPKAPKDFRDAWAVLPEIPKQGDVHHLIYGDDNGLPVTCFRHRYVVSTGQSAAVIIHWVFSAEVADWPEIHVKRRSFFPRLVGKRSNVVLDDDRFDRHWVIKCKDRAFARAFLSPQTRAFLESPRADAKKPNERWHVVGAKLCCVVRSNLDAAGVRVQLQRLHQMLDTVSGQRVLADSLR